jgi:hypothetical protein
VIQEYEARAARHAARRTAWERRSRTISRLRLLAFIPGAAALVWAFGRGMPPAPIAAGVALLAVFAVLVVWHARVDARVAWHDALHQVNLHALARIGRAWDRMPPAEPADPAWIGSTLEHHPYALDLDLFGRASLLQWLGPAATAPGAGTLQRWLSHPAAPGDIRARQQAVAELAPALDWREQLGAHGRLAADIRPAELARFLAWAEGPGSPGSAAVGALRAAVWTLTAAIWVLIGLHAAGVTEAAFWLVPIVLGMILSFATAGRVHGQFNRAGSGQQAFARYAHLFAHAVDAPSSALYLRAIHERLGASGAAAPDCMRRLNRVLGFAQLRSGAGILHFPIQALTLWDFHVYFALDRWRRQVGSRARDWMAALGELDALSAFAGVQADNPRWCLPDISDSEMVVEARGLGHPLIPDDRRVANDVTVGPQGTLLLITGSNMSGKSTLLRALGLNTVLAQAGAPVCATSLRLPPVDLETSIRVQDSLEHGLSYFMAALARLKGVVDRSQRTGTAAGGRTLLYLLDEILQGTNTAERAIAVRGVARHLLHAGAIGVMTTHDLGLAGEEPLSTAARLVHFSETVDEHGGMTFDYRLRDGLATSRNALRLMHLIGITLDEDRAAQKPAGTLTGVSGDGPS